MSTNKVPNQFLLELQQTPTASKRQVKYQSRTQSRKQANSRITLQRVGGTLSVTRAIYAPSDAHLCNILTRPTLDWDPVVTREGDLGGR